MLYFKLIGISLRSQMQHRASFFMLAGAHFLGTFVDILGIWILFDRFEMIKGWTLPELALIYGIMHMGFAIAEASARGFDTFSELLKHGDFDRVLLRPCPTLLQIASRDFQALRVGRFLQGLVVLLWAAFSLHLPLLSAAVIPFSILGAASLFYALMILQATLCFWTTETLEIMNIVTYGGVETGQYPITIYNKALRLFFTFIIPIACVGYYPVAILLKHENFPYRAAFGFPLLGVVFLLISFRIWHFGVQRYQSTGS